MKNLLGKVMEHILVGMAVIVQGMPNYKQEFQKVQFQLQKQDVWLGRIERHLPCILFQTEMSRTNAKDPVPVESTSTEQHD